jgi:hypothetical protein
VLLVPAWSVHADHAPLSWTFAALFAVNTAANLTGTHPVERWGMSAATLALTGAFVTLALT